MLECSSLVMERRSQVTSFPNFRLLAHAYEILTLPLFLPDIGGIVWILAVTYGRGARRVVGVHGGAIRHICAGTGSDFQLVCIRAVLARGRTNAAIEDTYFA